MRITKMSVKLPVHAHSILRKGIVWFNKWVGGPWLCRETKQNLSFL